APQGSSIAPFGFTGELQDGAGQVYLRARWYTPVSGTFTSRDSFVGWPEQPYSLNYYQYGYSNPILLSDPAGNTPVCPVLYCTVQTFVDWRLRNWDFNWDLVRSIKGLIIKAAQNHERPGDDFPWQTMAALMGAHVAREKRTQMLEYDALGELKATVDGSNNPSTGIANIRPDVVVKTYNGELEFGNTESQPGKYQFTTLNLFRECLGDGVLDKNDYKAIRDLLQSPEVSLDILGANIERGIDRIRLYGIQPSIFNAGNWIWNGNQDPVVIRQGINEGLSIDDVTKGYIHGLVMIQQLPKAAQELGVSLPIYRKYHTDTDLTKDESQFIPDELK
ncbi:MAG: hypothetical protein HGA65_01490, partial [Oscillochloris sp.]|nr:hypothetical protein [Oscillochloris sp.]